MRGLRTDNERHARNLLARLELQITAVRQGLASIPETADPVDWLLSAGVREKAASGPVDGCRTLGELLSRYDAALPLGAVAATTRATAKIHHEHLRKGLGARKPLRSIGVEELQAYANKRKASGATVRKELATLRTAWRWAAKSNVAPSPPDFGAVRYAKPPEAESFRTAADGGEGESLVLTTGEVRAFLEWVRAEVHQPWLVAAWEIAAYTGMRRSELVRARAGDVDWRRGEIVVREKKRVQSQSESTRRIPIAKPLAPTLKRLVAKAKGGPLLGMPQRKRPEVGLSNAWNYRRGQEDCPWLAVAGFHVMRHSFASNLAAAGVSQTLIDEWMGHQTEQQRKRYRHFFPHETATAIAALER